MATKPAAMVPRHLATATLRDEATGRTHSRFLYAGDDGQAAAVWWFTLLVHPAELRAGLHAARRRVTAPHRLPSVEGTKSPA